MASEIEDKIKEFLAGVERDENGIVVLSPYGFKIIEIEGKRYVASLTEKEWIEAVKERQPNLLPAPGDCYTPATGAYCLRGSCTRTCILVPGPPNICICTY
jgi:hypothetical protein